MTDSLVEFQQVVAQAFLSLHEAEGFALAGGSALIAHGAIDRPTRDLDIFATPSEHIPTAHEAFLALAEARGWTVETITSTETFARTIVRGPFETILDLAVDSPPSEEAVMTVYGRTLSLVDLAARKVLALFDRAEARDFTDIYELRHRFSKDEMLRLAGLLDTGFDRQVFADMLGSLKRFENEDIPLPHDTVPDCRTWFATWRDELAESE
ncbi:MAG TPA: hypothetical protein ENH15_04545 [Actinobacteria bacterium]|nr:hypothetical protein [Actinomycetota bacterium]